MGFFTEYLTVSDVADFFDTLTAKETEALHIYRGVDESGNHRYLTIKDMFKAHYYGAKCIYPIEEKETAKTVFIRIFYDNLILVSKISKYEDILKDLENFDLYQTEIKGETSTETDGNSQGTNTQTQERNLIDGHLTAQYDARTQSTLLNETRQVLAAKSILEKSKNKHLDYIDPNARSVVQNIDHFTGKETFTTDQNGTYGANVKGKNFTATSNPMQDRVTYLKLEIPKLRLAFLSSFSELFTA